MRKLIWITLLIVLTGCQSNPTRVSSEPPSLSPQPAPTTAGPVETLYALHDDWRGTRYRLGGMSRSGVDCSGFVNIVYHSGFGIRLPRTTLQQSQLGRHINRSELQAGDLVFFNTREKVRHVGVYVEDGLFLHASTGRGVMLSRLDNPYWRGSYWMSRRVGGIQ